MTSAAKITLRLVFILAISLQAQHAFAQDSVQIAEEEAVRRQEATIRLHMKLDQAVAAQKRNQLVEAAKLYQEAVALTPYVQVGNAAVNLEKRQALAGLDGVREKLARQAMDRGEMAEALAQVEAALKVDPSNEPLRKLKREIDKRTAEMQGTVPSPDLVKTIPDVQKERVDVATKVQNAKLMYEMGKYVSSSNILAQVLKADPSNKTAAYYMELIQEATFAADSREREAVAKSSMATVTKEWIPPSKQDNLPVPNPMAHTNLVYTTPGRQEILSKLDHIHRNEVRYDLSLDRVLNDLREDSKKRDPDGVGINFMWNPHADAGTGAAPTADTTGAAAAGAVAAAVTLPPVDITSINIKIDPPLDNLRYADILDAITKSADPTAIKYTIEDYAVVFSPKPAENAALYTKVFKVDPNTFVQGLENVTSILLNTGGGTGSIGGQGGGGSSSSSGTGASSGGTSSTGVTIPSVTISPVSQGGAAGAGAVGGGAGRIGLDYVTKTNNTQDASIMVINYFKAAGVDLTPPKNVFFNDRLGELLVRASLSDLEIIEQAIELLNQAPPQVTIEAKFVELTQEDSRALGFSWYMGNTLVNNGAIGVQGGTAPSYQNPNGSAANPSGIFPGPGSPSAAGGYSTPFGTFAPGPGVVTPSGSDNSLTTGVLNQYTLGNTTGQIPTVATISGILTDPQFRVAINAIQTRTGSDLLSAPKVTTLSGRQAHVSGQDLETIVVNSSVSTSSSSTGGLVGGVGAVVPSINYNTSAFGIGPVLDVMPTVSADGFSIQMVLLPTILEFIGYDPPGAFVPESVAASGGAIGVPITAQLPLPHFRVREVATTCNVWDGQTVVLGGMISETITKVKSQVPVLGDLPLVGRLFQSESTDNQKGNLLIFVTPTIIDPAGNRVHNDDDMPFARSSIPPQPPATAQ